MTRGAEGCDNPIIMSPWDHWYHLTAHTYGTWLRGDARGYRARHHREHVDGDYKHRPPPEKYVPLLDYSKSLMKRDPLRIEHECLQFVLDMMVERLLSRDNDVDVASQDPIHFHGLVRCVNHNPRIELGIAKQYATAQLKAHGFAMGLRIAIGQGIWGKRFHPEPITCERHFHKAHDYIRDHAERGAVVYEPAPYPEMPEVNLLI